MIHMKYMTCKLQNIVTCVYTLVDGPKRSCPTILLEYTTIMVFHNLVFWSYFYSYSTTGSINRC